jgi:predicted dienelactone hydrolase
MLLAVAILGCSSAENSPSLDGDLNDGDVADGDNAALDGDATDNDGIDGDLTDGDATDGDDVDGDLDGDPDNPIDGDHTEEDMEEAWRLPYMPPDARGVYNVGAISVRYVNEEQGRDLPGTIWYPTEATEGERTYYQDLIPAPGVFKNAPIASGGPFPVVVFSHGNQGFAEQSAYFTEFAATHGFVVAAVDHIGNTTGTFEQDLMAYSAQQRPRDLSIVVDHLELWQQDSEHILFGKMNLELLGGVGHSFGGYTVLYWAGASLHREHLDEACGAQGDNKKGFCELLDDAFADALDYDAQVADPRVKSIVPLAPAGWAVFGPDGMADVSTPVQLQVGDADITLPPEQESLAMYPELHTPKCMMVMAGAGHFTFTDMCDIYPQFGDGCGDEFIDAEIAYKLSNLYALAFLRVTLLGETRDEQYLTQEYADTLQEITWSFEW